MGRRSLTSPTRIGLLAAVLLLGAGCGDVPARLMDPGAGSTIPPGAQVVRVAITDEHVALAPPAVRAGQVYLVLEASPAGGAVLIGGAAPGEPDGAPLPAGAVERLRRGDAEGTSMTGFDSGGCSPEQDVAGVGRLGPCGNVAVFTLRPGQYAILAGAPETNATRPKPLPIGVLTVTP